jgi:hypothetical protein
MAWRRTRRRGVALGSGNSSPKSNYCSVWCRRRDLHRKTHGEPMESRPDESLAALDPYSLAEVVKIIDRRVPAVVVVEQVIPNTVR